MIVYAANDNLLELTDLTNEATGALISDATVTVALEDEDGAAISGESWPIPMPPVAGTAGAYRVTLEDVLALTPGRPVYAVVDVLGDGLTATWRRALQVRARR